jgi:hypothetical protein
LSCIIKIGDTLGDYSIRAISDIYNLDNFDPFTIKVIPSMPKIESISYLN